MQKNISFILWGYNYHYIMEKTFTSIAKSYTKQKKRQTLFQLRNILQQTKQWKKTFLFAKHYWLLQKLNNILVKLNNAIITLQWGVGKANEEGTFVGFPPLMHRLENPSMGCKQDSEREKEPGQKQVGAWAPTIRVPRLPLGGQHDPALKSLVSGRPSTSRYGSAPNTFLEDDY